MSPVFGLFLLHHIFSLKISPEVPVDLSLTLCSHQNKVKTHNHMQFFPRPVAYCATLHSSKHRRHQLHDEKQSTSLSSLVSLSWRNVASNVQCRVQYKGYQSEYRFSPDFGAYEACQFVLSRHLFNLPESPWMIDTPPVALNDTQSNCPLTALPATYGDYVSCSLTSSAWYILNWHSAIKYETFHNGSYGTYWANYSTSFVFQPMDRLSLNGTEDEWLHRLLTVETRAIGCETATVLILVDPLWVPLSTISVFYRIKYHQNQNQKIHSQLISNQPIDRWLQLDFPLRPVAGTVHELCVQLTSSAVPSALPKLCKSIVDSIDCPFSSSLTISFPLVFFLALFLS